MEKKNVLADLSASPLRCGIVLAGGDGKRLRSFVHRTRHTDLPKQYVNLIGAHSMLEHTFRRAEKLIHPEQLFTIVSEPHLAYTEVRRQLAGRPKSTVVVQPENKETGPGILLPLLYLYQRYPHSLVALFPSDHFILEERLFMAHVYLAFRAVERNPSRLVLLGIQPDGAESDYGYIVPGRRLSSLFPLDVREISRFIEKPEAHSVPAVIQKGGLWNTMVMVFKPSILLKWISRITTNLFDSFQRIAGAIGKPHSSQVVREVYRQIEPWNFSKTFLESLSLKQPSGLTVLLVRGVHWSDWGSGQRIVSTLKQTGAQQCAGELQAPAVTRSKQGAITAHPWTETDRG